MVAGIQAQYTALTSALRQGAEKLYRSGTERATDVASSVYKKAAPHFQEATKFGSGIVHILVGGFLTGISSVMKTFAKDNTALDIGGWIGIIVGVLFMGSGAFKLWRREKETKVVREGTDFKVSDNLSNRCTNACKKVKEIDSAFQDPQDTTKEPSKIYSGNTTGSNRLRPEVLELYKAYRDVLKKELKPVIEKLAREENSPEPILTNVSDQRRTIADLQYDNAMLLGYLVGSRSHIKEFDQDQICKQLSDVLKDTEIPRDHLYVVSPHFAQVYTACRDYALNHEGKNNSIHNRFERELGTRSLANIERNLGKVQVTGLAKDQAREFLYTIGYRTNELKILYGALKYVKENSNSTNIEERKQADVLRAAIICGLRLRVKNTDEFLEKSYEQIMAGKEVAGGPDSQGLQAKIEALDAFIDKLDSEVLTTECLYEKKSLETDAPFAKDANLFEFSQKS